MKIVGMRINGAIQREAAESVCSALMSDFGDEELVAEAARHSGGRLERHYVSIDCPPALWRLLAETLSSEHGADHCSMITGIHWPEKSPDMQWQVIIHLMRTTVRNPPSKEKITQPIAVDATIVQGDDMPLEFEIRIAIPETREPAVASVADIWVGADWNEKETWDLVGIDFEGHEGMRRVLLPHETPAGYHPLQKQHKLRYHDYEEMYDDPQGFQRKPVDKGRVK